MNIEKNSKQLEIDNIVNDIWEDECILDMANTLITKVEDFKFKEARKIYAKLFALLMIKQKCSIQVLVGSLLHKVNQELIEPILSVFTESVLVEYKDLMFISLVPYESESRHILPSNELPEKVVSNWNIGYKHYITPLILGSFPNDEKVNLSFINLTNSVPYTLEKRTFEPVFNSNPKIKKDGNIETKGDIARRYESFNHIISGIEVLKDQLDTFYYCHCYDSRGRVYPKAYEFNYQGIKYIKALVNFEHKEVIKNEF